jgi:transposase
MAAIPITRGDLTASDLRSEAAWSKNTRIARRLLALAMVMEGHPRAIAARSGAMDRQTLRDWVHRYNEHGLAGLSDGAHPGRPRLLSDEQEKEIDAWVEAGPGLAEDGVVRWRRIDLRERIKARFKVTFHVRSVGKLLRRMNFRRISVRPQHPESEPGAQETFKKRAGAAGPPVALETDRAILSTRGAAEKFLVDLTP